MFESLSEFPVGRRWREQTYPGPIVVAIIQRQTAVSYPHYLLIRRNSSPYNGQWALVGGKWDFGESLMTAVTREVKEETNLDTTFTALRGIVNERLAPSNRDGNAAHFLIFVCELAANDGIASEQNEGEVTWFTQLEIDVLYEQNTIIPSDYLMIQQFTGSKTAVPHFEAEMLTALGDDRAHQAQLIRFQRINGLESERNGRLPMPKSRP